MRLLAITLALATLTSSLALPAPFDDTHTSSVDASSPPATQPVSRQISAQAIAAKLKKRQTSRADIIARQQARGLMIARKGKRRTAGKDVQPYFKRNAGEAEDNDEEEQEEDGEASAGTSKCEGRQFAYFANVSWKVPTQDQDLGRFFTRDGSAYNSWECALRCHEAEGCTYASVYDNMCEITGLTHVPLQLGGAYQSILPGSCKRNIASHGLPSYTPCEELCFIKS